MLGDERPVITHAFCKIDDHAGILGHILDFFGEGYNGFRGNDQQHTISGLEHLFITGCPDARVEKVGREVLGVSVVFIDILHYILFDGPKDDCVVGIPREPFGHGGAKDAGSGDYDGLMIVQGATPWPCGQIMVLWGMSAS